MESEGFRVNWFPPGRPVEGNTIFVRPDTPEVPMPDTADRPIGPAEIVARLETCAAGRREYAENAPDALRAELIAQAAVFESAARIARGDLGPLYGLLPSWRWTPEMHVRLDAKATVPGE